MHVGHSTLRQTLRSGNVCAKKGVALLDESCFQRPIQGGIAAVPQSGFTFRCFNNRDHSSANWQSDRKGISWLTLFGIETARASVQEEVFITGNSDSARDFEQ